MEREGQGERRKRNKKEGLRGGVGPRRWPREEFALSWTPGSAWKAEPRMDGGRENPIMRTSRAGQSHPHPSAPRFTEEGTELARAALGEICKRRCAGLDAVVSDFPAPGPGLPMHSSRTCFGALALENCSWGWGPGQGGIGRQLVRPQNNLGGLLASSLKTMFLLNKQTRASVRTLVAGGSCPLPPHPLHGTPAEAQRAEACSPESHGYVVGWQENPCNSQPPIPQILDHKKSVP